MARLTRAQQQQRTRAAVLAAAGQEFSEYGYELAKVDRTAERAELTRGAVYSNFPSKRALYLAVLLDLIERRSAIDPKLLRPASPASPAEAVGAFARVWLERLPLTGDAAADGRLRLLSLTGVLDDSLRPTYTQLLALESVLLSLAIEACDRDARRRVRLARLVLTVLGGAASFAEAAPGHGDPFDIIQGCRQLADADLADTWDPPHAPYVPPAAAVDDEWAPPAGLIDMVAGREVDLGADGVIMVLGSRRLAAAEEAVRSAAPGERVTVVIVTTDPAETGRLVRLRIADLAACLRDALGTDHAQRLHIVLDDDATLGPALGPALGLADLDDEAEIAARIRDGRVVARAAGRGAGLAVSRPAHRDEARPR